MSDNDNIVTVDGILAYFQKKVEQKIPVSPATWLDGCQKLNALMSNLNDDMISAEMAYRRLRAWSVQNGDSGIKAETVAKASAEYELFLRLKSKKEMCEAFIQIAKKTVELRQWDV